MDTSRSSRRIAARRRRLGLAAVLFVVLVAALAGGASGASQRSMPSYNVQELGSLGGPYSAGTSIMPERTAPSCGR